MSSNCGSSNAIHPQFHGRASDLAYPVTHSAHGFFERPSVLIIYEGSHNQEVFPQVGCRGPQLDFVVTSDSRNLIELNKIILDVESAIFNADGKTSAEGTISVFFNNNTLQSLPSHAEVFLNGILISTSNNSYHHSVFIETEMTTDLDSKTTWAENKGYQHRGNKSTVEEVNKCVEEKFKQGKCTKNKTQTSWSLSHFFESKKNLLPGATLHLRLHRPSNDFFLQSLAESDDKVVIVIERASVFVTKLILKDSVRLSTKKH